MRVGAPRLPGSNQDDRTGRGREEHQGSSGMCEHYSVIEHQWYNVKQRHDGIPARWTLGAGARVSGLGLRSAQLPTLSMTRNSTLPLSHSGLSSDAGSVSLCHHCSCLPDNLTESTINSWLSFDKIGSCLRHGIANSDYNKDAKGRNNSVYRA